MPITEIVPTRLGKARTKKERQWKPDTRFAVVGNNYGRSIAHHITVGEGEGVSTRTVLIENEVTAAELIGYNIDINDWIARELIISAREFAPTFPDRDEDYGLVKPRVNTVAD